MLPAVAGGQRHGVFAVGRIGICIGSARLGLVDGNAHIAARIITVFAGDAGCAVDRHGIDVLFGIAILVNVNGFDRIDTADTRSAVAMRLDDDGRHGPGGNRAAPLIPLGAPLSDAHGQRHARVVGVDLHEGNPNRRAGNRSAVLVHPLLDHLDGGGIRVEGILHRLNAHFGIEVDGALRVARGLDSGIGRFI